MILTLCLAGCHTSQVKDDTIRLFTLKGPSAMGMIYLIDSPGKIITKPLSIEILDEPMLVRARLLKDKPEMAVLPLNMSAILYNKGLPYQLVAVPVWGSLYLFGSDSTVLGWQSLKNKRIFMMGKGSTPDIVFRFLLKFHKLNPETDVTLDYSFPTHIDLANAVSAGKAPIAIISEPLATLAQAKNPSIGKIMDLNSEWGQAFPSHPSIPQTAFIGRSDFIREHPDWVKKICEAWMVSIDRVNLFPEQAADLIAGHNILPDNNIAKNSIPGCNLKFRYAFQISPEINQYLQVLFTFNPDAVGGKIPDEQFIYQIPDH